MRRLALSLCIAVAFALPARAAMKIDVSEDNIEVTTGFNGTSITVFGTQEEPGDVVLVIQGPDKNFTVRKKGRTLGLWTNVDSHDFNDVPGYYEVAASSALALITTPEVLAQYHIGIDNLSPLSNRAANSARLENFRNAFLEDERASGLYVMDTRPLTHVSENLFKARFILPAGVPQGRYSVYAYLFQNGQMLQQDQASFEVKPVGLSAELRRFAQDNSLIYGLAAILVAVFAGWLATVLLKRD